MAILSPDLLQGRLRRIGAPTVNACAADLDNTILNTLPIEIISIRHVLKGDYGRNLPEEAFYTRWNGRGGMFNMMAEEMGLGVPGEVLKRKIRAHFNYSIRDGIPYVPGAEDFLQECNSRGIRVAIATSTDRQGMFHKADTVPSLYRHISAWASGSEVSRGKPEPDVFKLALWRLQADHSMSFGIGDTEHDMEGLEKAGVPVKVLVTGERGSISPNTKADIIVKSPGDLDSNFFDLLQGHHNIKDD